MSVLTFLCLTSLLCLSLADPVPSAQSSPSSAAQSSAGPEPTDGNEPISSEEVQAEVQAIMDEIEQILPDRLSEIQKGLTSYDKDYSSFTLLECFKGCLNNLVYMRNEALYSKSAVPKSNAVTLTLYQFDKSYLPSSYYEPGSLSGVPNQGATGPDFCME